jgi:hypothetical protein
MGADPGFERFSGDHVVERYAAERSLQVEEVREALIDWVVVRGGRVEQVHRRPSRGMRPGQRVARDPGPPVLSVQLPNGFVGRSEASADPT